jgi:hypothetical protein
VAELPAHIEGPALIIANGSGFTVTAPTLLSVLLQSGVAPDVMVMAVNVTLNVPADAVVALDEADVVSITWPSPVPFIVLPVVAPSL